MRMSNSSLAITVLLLGSTSAHAADPVDYVRQIKPILAKHCYACHGSKKQESGLRLDTAALAIKGGESGPAIVPGNSAESLLIQAVTGSDLVDRMPLKGKPLDEAQIDLLKTWIDQGAKAPDEPVPKESKPARRSLSEP